jgi:hypothetical protein
MSSDLTTELSALRTLIITAKDDIMHTREAYSHDALATPHFAYRVRRGRGCVMSSYEKLTISNH